MREFRVDGAKVWYSGSDKATEQIKIDGKIKKPIKVHVSNQCCFYSIYSDNIVIRFPDTLLQNEFTGDWEPSYSAKYSVMG